MASLKDIKRRIKSVKNTRKITYAMKLVSAAKLKKAQDAVTSARSYTEALNGLLARLAAEQSGASFSHPLMETRSEVKNVRIVVIGGSRGLCGGFNTNINKKIDQTFREIEAKYAGVQISSIVVGKKPAEHYRRKGIEYLKSYEENLPEDANLWPVDEICRALEQDFTSAQVDEVYLIYTRFKSAMTQTVEQIKILPLDASEAESASGSEVEHGSASGSTLFEPSPVAVFSAVIPRILRTKVRQAGLDSKASEHGSRMVAMDAATSNAADLIHKLTLKHNKLRQGAITAELLDIIGGANAIED
jgi:F-type H+-transporting ATPase subunit gamma